MCYCSTYKIHLTLVSLKYLISVSHDDFFIEGKSLLRGFLPFLLCNLLLP